MWVESKDTDISEMLISGYYVVPRFQRPYSWEREHIQEFWNDIIRDEPDNYFIGSMVVFKIGEHRFGIVDGQQRLTTITIFLAVLRDILRREGHEGLARGIQGLLERKNLEHRDEYVLATESSFPFFQSQIQSWDKHEIGNPEYKEESNLRMAYSTIRDLVHGAIQSIIQDPSLTAKRQADMIVSKLKGIRDSLLRLRVIRVTLDNEDDAYIIFETLNTRGKDLRLSDLVKNHITRHLKTRNASVDPVRERWHGLIEIIQGSAVELDIDTFIHHYWLSRYDYITLKQLYKELKRIISKTKADAFLTSLHDDAKLYRMMHDLQYHKWKKEEVEVKNSLAALNLFRVKQQIPSVLSLLRSYRDSHIKLKHLTEALHSIERFHFLFTAITSQRSSGGISFMYAASARRIAGTKDANEIINSIRELKGKLIEKLPSREEFIVQFPSLIYTNDFSKERALVKYTLSKLYPIKQSVAVDFDSMTIEHLRSQSEIGHDGLTTELIGQVGNLILITKELNNKLSNKTFTQKKRILKEHDYPVDQILESSSDLNASDIQRRTELLAKRAYDKVWKI